jgi:hypothetical protein
VALAKLDTTALANLARAYNIINHKVVGPGPSLISVTRNTILVRVLNLLRVTTIVDYAYALGPGLSALSHMPP